ncbi:MAG: hypothetical protein AAFR87_15320 [Bacteroidota bacterium]
MNYSLRTLLLIGVAAEIAIFAISYAMGPSIEEAFRYSARFSGRLSAFVFLYTFYQFARHYPQAVKENTGLRNWITTFAVLHVIHWGFLASNVYLNNIPLEAVKIAGGALGYLMIVAAPFYIHKLNLKFQLPYFYYVSLVMILTYVARAKGDFEGAEPSWFHFTMLGIFTGACALFGYWIFKKSRKELAGGA